LRPSAASGKLKALGTSFGRSNIGGATKMGTTVTHRPPGRRNEREAFAAAGAAIPAQPSLPEFRVRFSQQPELPALLRKPTNSFHWTGAGSLRFEPLGITVSARRRRVLGFYRTEQRFITASEIRDVYRESNVVRVDLRSTAGPSPFFRFWAETSAAAAAIVELLPTAHTIEFEDGMPWRRTAAPRTITRPWGRRGVWLSMVALVLLVPAIWLAGKWLQSPGVTPLAPQPQTLAAASDLLPTQHPDALTQPVRRQLQKISDRADALATQFSMAATSLQAGTLTQEGFADGLDNWLAPQWRVLQVELESNTPLPQSAAAGVFEPLFAATLDWQRALKAYSSGLRAHNPGKVLRSFDYVRDAEDSQRQARNLLSEP
jgi:hypothetical protein